MSSTLLIAIVTIAGTFGFMLVSRRRLNARYAHMRAGQVVQRLGLELVEGDADHNLATQSVRPSAQNVASAKGFLDQMAATQVGGTLGEFKLRAVGQPYGVDTELVLYCREDLTPGLVRNTTTTWHDLRLTVQVRAAIPPFDLRLRAEAPGLETRRAPDDPRMPAQRFGDPALDQRFVIETPDPMLPRRIASALGPLAHPLAYVHVAGAGNHVSFVMTPTTVTCAAMAFDQLLHALASIAATVEGRPLPAPAAGGPA